MNRSLWQIRSLRRLVCPKQEVTGNLRGDRPSTSGCEADNRQSGWDPEAPLAGSSWSSLQLSGNQNHRGLRPGEELKNRRNPAVSARLDYRCRHDPCGMNSSSLLAVEI